jgi:hypothetical protein
VKESLDVDIIHSFSLPGLHQVRKLPADVEARLLEHPFSQIALDSLFTAFQVVFALPRRRTVKVEFLI